MAEYSSLFTDLQKKFIFSFLNKKTLTFSQFYLLFKIHKEPLKNRPIVSVSGSFLHGLAIWVDHQLKPIVKRLDSYVKSTVELISMLPSSIPPNAKLFTTDATCMYTNMFY